MEITEFERHLDVRAEAVTQRVLALCQPVRDRNNKRWEQFAELCRFPVIGGLIQKRMVMPWGLESEPKHYDEEWYQSFGRQIEADAEELEAMKAAHLEHWGEEIISPMDDSDPGGYHTPHEAPRSECYRRGLGAFVPGKFDFSSGAGCDKNDKGRLVMCSITRRIVEMNDCDFVSDRKGVRYRLREHSSPDPTIPGFNEWRDDAQVAAARDRERPGQFGIA